MGGGNIIPYYLHEYKRNFTLCLIYYCGVYYLNEIGLAHICDSYLDFRIDRQGQSIGKIVTCTIRKKISQDPKSEINLILP